ncbi:D-alanyl-D-alanine carboxypeptidase/D-alanyl-D-alanine endopeptidase [Allonocardiopsis opalescens]|uniref:D-alanyl-D-alanine carboxypeptidase/D-alanyl-D-alanine-endopeptidase (Penicillin-binding protein 4) n=1 Tax=Allonocardiopsis opalescens TaxID=1144618 RepID=A0A2T0Q231_9ACTN|nr:D-alanyl-D-alanine carboxypeptidase/D-alanyl-D-alanine-endopeptidase [Allonocardiopsis opalescens]PRX97854.1 D-alanyl-D-alanine carboxypeptidase/D-alanyl-D-alanine-endopeptidase (penicillin-binding protein 4) [Allonocardiopsis opalescens]
MRRERALALAALALLNVFTITVALAVVVFTLTDDTAPVWEPSLVQAEPAPVSAGSVSEVDAGSVADRLAGPLQADALGTSVAAVVTDTATGSELFDHNGDAQTVPASTTKIATGVAALNAVGTEFRLTTRVVQGAGPEEVVLVGGGDPTLSRSTHDDGYPQAATLDDLATATAAALEAAGVGAVRVRYDTSLYEGPETAPGWREGYVTEGSVAPVTALMVDGGRTDPAIMYSPRYDDPASSAAETFAELLREAGLEVEGGVDSTTAPAGAPELAAVQSAPVASLVEDMMTSSDNNIAEALARQVAIALGEPASFEGGAAAMTRTLAELGVGEMRLEDASGLSRNNAISAQTMVNTLMVAADPERPELSYALSGLPIGGFTGTLDQRYVEALGGPAEGAGVVRAKTGTLSGVSTLAGLVQTDDGQLLAFAFMADDTAGYAPLALDQLAAALAECGCSAGGPAPEGGAEEETGEDPS